MSIAVMTLVFAHQFPDLEADEDAGARYGVSAQVLKLMMLSMADTCWEDGSNAHPGVRRLARQVQVHTDTINIARKHLIAAGYITLTKPGRAGWADTYRLNLDRLTAAPPVENPELDCAGDPRTDESHPRAARGSTRDPARGSDPRTTSLPSVHPVFDPGPAASDELRRQAASTARAAELAGLELDEPNPPVHPKMLLARLRAEHPQLDTARHRHPAAGESP